MERLIFHVDVNSAFLSWTAVKGLQEGQQDLRRIPACVGGNPKKRTGVVLAKSIPAKKYGVTTGEPIAMALRKCPDLTIVPPDFALYDRCSRAFKAICREYAPVVESFSIDEVFLDMTGTHLIYPDPIATAYEIKNKIRDTLGFTVNIGIGTNKLLAKMAGDFEKPDKVHTLFPDEIAVKMWPLPAGELLSVGKMTVEKLKRMQINTIGELAHADISELQSVLGMKLAQHIHRYANGIDDDPVKAQPEEAKGYSVETTLEEDIVTVEEALPILLSQTDIVCSRMREAGAQCGCVSVSWRNTEFKNKSHQCRLPFPTDVTDEIYAKVRQLFEEGWNRQPLRLIGIALTEIDRGEYQQMTLFEDETREKQKKVDQAIDSIRGKFGRGMIMRASTMEAPERIGRKYKAQMDNRFQKRAEDKKSEDI